MKYITFTVPCYNSEHYMKRCLDSLLVVRDGVEIIIVDDGSTDATGTIADEYSALYPDVVKVVHQENGGHGAGVNAGLKLAQGRYFKVVDSDDWLDKTAYEKLLARIKEFCVMGACGKEQYENTGPDLIVCNYIYDHLEEGTGHTVRYRNVFPKNRMCGWQETGHFSLSQYLVMHALIFRTQVLKESKVKLPRHTFYVDNLFANQPLPFVERILYLDVDLYHYYLGRDDQSVNEEVLKKRIDQQIRVTLLVVECADLQAVRKKSPRLEKYLCRNISIMMAISSIHLLLIGTPQAYEKRKKLLHRIRARNPKLYIRLRYRSLCGFTYLPGRLGRWLTVKGYRLANRLYHFQ